MTVIAMTRELATRGKDVAAQLSEKLGLDVIHHEVVEHEICERAGLPESQVHRYLEGAASLLERWKIDRKKLSRFTALEILELAQKGNVIIRGWGAVYLLRHISHVVSIRTAAPMAFREDVLMDRLGIESREKARREIVRNDAAHNGAMQSMFGIDWQDSSHYAATFNTQKMPIDDIVSHIVTMSQSEAFQETEASRRVLSDTLIEAKIKRALEDHFELDSATLGISASVNNGHVALSGAVTDEGAIVDAIRLISAIDGVKRVESKIDHVDFHPVSAF